MIKKISTMICICLLLSSCSKALDDNISAEGTISLEANLNSLVDTSTKTGNAPIVILPSSLMPLAGDLALSVTGTYINEGSLEEISYSKLYDKFVNYDRPFVHEGNYTAAFSFGSAEIEAFDKPYFSGSVAYEIIARMDIEKAVTVNLKNSVLDVEFTDFFRKYYTKSEFTVRTESGASFKFTLESAPRWLFVKANTRIFVSGHATKQNGVLVEFVEQEVLTSKPQTKHTIIMDASKAGSSIIDIIINNETVFGGKSDVELNPEA